MWVTPLRLETERYERIPYDERKCFNCINVVENEEHVLIECPLYKDIRKEQFSRVDMPWFELLSTSDKICHLMSNSQINTGNYSDKACHDILTEFLYR